MAMSGIYLPALFAPATTGNQTQNLLGVLSGTPNSMGLGRKTEALANLRRAEANQDRLVADVAKQPQLQREVAAFRVGIAKAGSASEALSNPAVMKVLLRANGLEDQEANKALARKALLSDPADSTSLASRLTDRRWKNTADIYQFAKKGLDILRDPKVLDTLTRAYAEVSWRKSLDETTPGLSDALTFREKAGKVASAVQILGDPLLRRVVTTALGVPLEIAFQSLEAQEKAITNRLDVARLKDPKFVESFVQRYLTARSDKVAFSSGAAGGSPYTNLSIGLVV